MLCIIFCLKSMQQKNVLEWSEMEGNCKVGFIGSFMEFLPQVCLDT